jgi:hypothetical protein
MSTYDANGAANADAKTAIDSIYDAGAKALTGHETQRAAITAPFENSTIGRVRNIASQERPPTEAASRCCRANIQKLRNGN